ncbi:MAG TPA: lysophospholipid transporter LplT [Variovorax sp.]
MPPGFYLVIAAQFASALADNALLIVAIAVLDERQLPVWWAPLLKFSFTIAYVLLAPVVGPLADAWPKAALMGWMNAVKVLGVIALLVGMHPLLAFAIVGLGAAAYAPAKYGIVTEMVPARHLVAANGWIEVTAVCAVLLGTVMGGALVGSLARASAWAALLQQCANSLPSSTPTALGFALFLLLGVYTLAGLLLIGIRDTGRRHAWQGGRPRELLRAFRQCNRLLWADRDGALSLMVTTLFWGFGATLQFAVLRWAVDALGLPLSQAAYLQAVVAVGVVAGATLAGWLVPIDKAARVLPAGILLGVLVAWVAGTSDLRPAVLLLVAVGAVGGILLVPMNAMLQHRGYRLLSAGRSIAVQGFNENLSVLCMVGVYAAVMALGVPIVPLMVGFGLLVAAAMAAIIRRHLQQGPSGLPGDRLDAPEP